MPLPRIGEDRDFCGATHLSPLWMSWFEKSTREEPRCFGFFLSGLTSHCGFWLRLLCQIQIFPSPATPGCAPAHHEAESQPGYSASKGSGKRRRKARTSNTKFDKKYKASICFITGAVVSNYPTRHILSWVLCFVLTNGCPVDVVVAAHRIPAQNQQRHVFMQENLVESHKLQEKSWE